MKLKITINLDNDAFQPDPAPEIDRCLRNFLNRLEGSHPEDLKNWGTTMVFIDSNGNRVGLATIED